jgi:hypothetical protein
LTNAASVIDAYPVPPGSLNVIGGATHVPSATSSTVWRWWTPS